MVVEIDEEFTAEDLLEELSQYHQPIGERREGGVTVAEYAENVNCTEKTARKWLDKHVKDGVLVREKCHLGPHSVGWVFYKA